MPAIEAILFDKDGTLVDFEATWGPTYLAPFSSPRFVCIVPFWCGGASRSRVTP